MAHVMAKKPNLAVKDMAYTIGKDGRLTLPTVLRRELHLEPSDKLQLVISDGRLIFLTPPINKRPKVYGKLYKFAVDVFDGNENAATSWLHRSQYGLNNVRPVDHMQTVKGAKDVEDLLGRMEYGELC